MTSISIRTLSTAGLCLIHEYGTQKPSCRKDKLYNSWWRPEVVVYQLSTTLGSCFYTYPSVTIANLWVEPSSWSVSHCSNSSRTSGNGLALSTVSCPNKQTNKQTIALLSIYQTSEYPFLHNLIGYSSSGYPVISTGLQNKLDTHASSHLSSCDLTIKITYFVTGYSLVWYILY